MKEKSKEALSICKDHWAVKGLFRPSVSVYSNVNATVDAWKDTWISIAKFRISVSVSTRVSASVKNQMGSDPIQSVNAYTDVFA